MRQIPSIFSAINEEPLQGRPFHRTRLFFALILTYLYQRINRHFVLLCMSISSPQTLHFSFLPSLTKEEWYGNCPTLSFFPKCE